MANANGTSRIGADQLQELRDNTPHNLQDNPLILYFRCKYSERDGLKQYYEQTDPVQRKRIDLELDRIDRLRSNFTKHVENVPLFTSMKHSRSNWRQHAKSKCFEEKKRLSRLLNKATTCELRKRYERDLCTLQAFEASADPLQHETGAEEDKGYGFVVYKISLKRKPPTKESPQSSYKDYSYSGYPLNDILYKKQSNPLMEECEENSIRYFHFPANNMRWVEVSNILPGLSSDTDFEGRKQ